MSYLIKHECQRCAAVGESHLSMAGKHIKQSCSHCLAYVKFYPQNLLPTFKELRGVIWQIAGGNVSIIDQAKKDILFPSEQITKYFEGQSTYDTYIYIWYWKLYLQIRKNLNLL